MIRSSNLRNHQVENDSTYDSIMVFRPQVSYLIGLGQLLSNAAVGGLEGKEENERIK